MPSQRAPNIYVRMLMPKGHGYPLWIPNPSDDLPDEYKRVGTQIGDLGYLDAGGGFVYLFNVGKAIDDPVNVGRTPPGFVPLSGIHDSTNQHLRLRNHGNGYVFEVTSDETKSLGGEISVQASTGTAAPSADPSFHSDFTSSSTEGAYLALPDGSSFSKFNSIEKLEKCAEAHAHEWYQYFNGEKGMQIHNGRLYLVTGMEKSRSWANACYSHTTESIAVSLKLKISGFGARIGGGLYYTWVSKGHSDVPCGTHPKPPASSLSALTTASIAFVFVALAFKILPVLVLTAGALAGAAVLLRDSTENQTIFLLGYSISVFEKARKNLRWKNRVKLYKMDENQTKPPKFDESVYPGASNTAPAATGTGTSGAPQGHRAGMGSGTTRPRNVDGPPVEVGSKSSEDESEINTSVMDIPYSKTTLQDDTEWDKVDNPSALINKYILNTHPNATIALTHDDFEWVGVEDSIQNPLNVMELATYAIDNDLVSINKSETTPNAWVAKRRDTNIGAGAFTREADTTYFQETLPKFTLSAFTETGQADSSIEVPMQRSYTGRRPVIPSSLADTPCAELGIQGVLDRLNAILGIHETSHELHMILRGFVERNDDLGTAYAHLRPVWNKVNPLEELRRREEEDRERRQKALVGKQIVNPDLPPRRVWDLLSNRVVPSWITEERPVPISHAWVDEKDRVSVWTPINGREWPVPIPWDADLNLIRIGMLNLGVEYTWLDVLCLRQKGGPREDLRVEEWRLDVPTIGRVYARPSDVVLYLSGLGRPLRLKDGDLDSNRSWFRRAWTLQEVGYRCFIAGDTPDGPMHAEPIDDKGNYDTALLTRFHKQLHSVKRGRHYIFALLAHMQRRVSTNPVDKVAGLAFPLRPTVIPAYNESETPEDAWTALVNAMYPKIRTGFLLIYPGVGLGRKKWRPTWKQVMTEPLPKDKHLGASVQYDNETDEDWFDGRCIEKGCVQGLDVGSAEGRDRCGELVIAGIPHTFKIRVTHQIPIPEDTYALIGGGPYWAVGRRLPGRRFEKVSVIMMDGDVNKAMQKLRDLNLVAPSRIFLI